MNYDAKFWYKRLEDLENEVTSIQSVNRDLVGRWSADCVALFSYLRVSPDIIRGFMNLFEHFDGSKIVVTPTTALYENWENPARANDRVKGFFYPNIAFTAARMLIERMEEEERLVPKNVITLLKDKADYEHLANSLESIEMAYKSNDTENLFSSTYGLLQSILNLNSDVQKIDRSGMKKQLEFLLDKANQSVLNDFGIDRDLIETLHQFRYLRHKVSQHKKPKSFKPPLSAGFGFASLVLMLLFAVMAQGTLIKV